mmetsp:Transcript_174773/g.554660  ORF Transcript_174773/g.554660 Transcript_174773/m.554660 type:complete len:103 (+) Transcript_174773:267-575(+)
MTAIAKATTTAAITENMAARTRALVWARTESMGATTTENVGATTEVASTWALKLLEAAGAVGAASSLAMAGDARLGAGGRRPKPLLPYHRRGNFQTRVSIFF